MERSLALLRTPTGEAARLILLAIGMLWLIVNGATSFGYSWQWHRVPRYLGQSFEGSFWPGPLLKGLGVTVEISAAALVLSLAIGLVTALARLRGSRLGQGVARVYLEIIRNTPLLIQIYLFYFVLAPIVGMSRWWVAVLSLALFEGASMSEAMRGAVLAVPRGHWESAAALGLSEGQCYRRVVLPQALRIALPALAGRAVSLVKASAIVSVIAVFDLTTEGRNIISDTFMTFEIWLTVAALYLLITTPLSLAAQGLERRLSTPT
ncbi:amino acid ABC transporter permease [Elioraea rosea]|uniref:amino acid ABC transporter permease n=1 Tax=Elioraea rosea TaxID=2492390 RepID=UPI001183AF3A|nr:amino acid ABC transporter permease [Elioraea rosea]